MAKLGRRLPVSEARADVRERLHGEAQLRSFSNMRRAALFLGAAVALAVSFGGPQLSAEAGAQPQWSPTGACVLQLPRNLTASRIDLVASPELSIFRREVMREDASPAEQQVAQAACSNAAQNPGGRITNRTRFSAPGYLCVGDASRRAAATQDRERNYQNAYCAYQTAATLAGIARTAGNNVAVEAYQGQAITALEWRTLSGPQTTQGAELLRAAARAYQALTQLQPNNAVTRYALADVYMQLGQDADAEREIQIAASLPSGGDDAARALVRLAEQRQLNGAPDDQVLALLSRALPSRSVSVNSAVGIVNERMGNSGAARQYFQNATAPNAVNDTGSAPGNYLAEAHYWLAELDSRTAESARDWEMVREHANAASRAGGVGLKNNRPLCLASIALGGDGVRDGTTASLCGSGQDPDSQLLRGIYLLRQAQYYTNFTIGRVSDRETLWRGYVMQALSAFVAGRTTLSATPQPTNPRQLAERRRLEGLLTYGEAVAQRVNAFCRVPAPSSINDPENFFGRLHVVDCRP